MKKTVIFMAAACLLLSAVAAFARIPNYTGDWELDVKKSKLPEMMRVESITMRVTHDAAKLTVETNTKRAPRPEGENQGGGMRPPGGMGRGGMMGGNGTVTYTLDGKEVMVETETPAGMPPAQITLVGNIEKDGKLKLGSSRKINSQTGEITIKTKETWELVEGGRVLKVTRETETPRGTQTMEMYFMKKDSTVASVNQTPKQVSGGLLNGKALTLVKPGYPAEAKEAKAAGGVNVQVVIDEQGNVVSAKAVSGHQSLRPASEEAARQSKFSPTLLAGVPVKVTGVIVYNFTAQ